MTYTITYLAIDEKYRINQFKFETSDDIDDVWDMGIPKKVIFEDKSDGAIAQWWVKKLYSAKNTLVEDTSYPQLENTSYLEMTWRHIQELRSQLLSYITFLDNTIVNATTSSEYEELLYKKYLEPLNRCESLIHSGKAVYVRIK